MKAYIVQKSFGGWDSWTFIDSVWTDREMAENRIKEIDAKMAELKAIPEPEDDRTKEWSEWNDKTASAYDYNMCHLIEKPLNQQPCTKNKS